MSLFSTLTRQISPVAASVAVSCLIAGTASAEAASSGSSWSSKPAWATEEGSSAPRSRKPSAASLAKEEDLARHNISPFSPGSNNLALDLGQVFLMGELGNKFSDNIGMQLHYTYGVSDLFGFEASAGYSDHSEGKYSMMTLLTGLRTNLAWYDKVVPHFNFGLGFYKPSFEQINTATREINSISPVLFGVHTGPGIDLELTRNLFFGADITFHNIFGNTRLTANGPLDVGGTFTQFFIHAGVTF